MNQNQQKMALQYNGTQMQQFRQPMNDPVAAYQMKQMQKQNVNLKRVNQMQFQGLHCGVGKNNLMT